MYIHFLLPALRTHVHTYLPTYLHTLPMYLHAYPPTNIHPYISTFEHNIQRVLYVLSLDFRFGTLQ